MKALALLLFFLLITFGFNDNLLAQDEGIYLTYSDYDADKNSFTKKDNLKYKLKINSSLNTKTIKIIIGDSIFKLCKDSIFGYRDSKNTTYRFYNKNEYKILNHKEFIILYSTTTLVSTKGFQTTTNYFFSTNSSSEIIPLTKLNLKIAFPFDSNFHELIDMYFDNDSQLVAYDSFYKVYKINRIYQLK